MPFPALAHPGFRVLWIGSLASFTAQWVLQVSLGWVAYEVTGSAALLGLIIGVRAIPMLLLAPFSGVAADRYDRRRMLALTQVALGLSSAVIALLLAAGALRTWHLFAYVLVNGAVGVLERNVRQAIIGDVVPREAVVNAVALSSIGFSGARVFAPALSGWLIAAAGAAGNFALQAVVWLGVAGTLRWVRVRPRPEPGRHASAWASLKEGMAFIAGEPTLRALMAVGMIPFLLLVPAWSTLFPVFASDVWAAGPQGLGWLLTAVGVGGLAGGLLGAWAMRLDRLGLIALAALAIFAAAVVGIGLAPGLGVALPFVVLAGVGEMLNFTAVAAMVQVIAPEAMRGRVTSLLTIFPALISLGSVPVGFAAATIGAPAATLGCGLLAALGCAALWAGSPRLRGARLSAWR